MTDRDRASAVAWELDIDEPRFLEQEFEVYRLLREHLPVARTRRAIMVPGAAEGGWLLTRYDQVADVLRNPADYSSQASSYPVRPWIPQAVDPPEHTAYRRILNPWFTVEAMAPLEPRLEQYAAELLDAMLMKDEFDWVADFADPFPTVIFCELVGFPLEDHAQIMDWKNTLMHSDDGHPRGHELGVARAESLGLEVDASSPLSGEVVQQLRASVGAEIYGYLAKQLEARRAEPRDDIISRLLAAKVENERPLAQEELEDTLFLLFMAGLDTVASVLGLIVRGFAQQPEKRREFVALMEDDEKLALAVEELVRYHAIVTPPRRATRELLFGGDRFAENEIVACSTPSANRDPEQFEDPEELRFDRFPNRHMGFGLGPHRCLGIHLARRELRIALRAFHRRLPDYHLHPERPPVLFGGMKGASSVWLAKGSG